MPPTIEDRLRTAVCDQLNLEPKLVTRDASFYNDLGCDSLDCVELLMLVEELFQEQFQELPGHEIPEIHAERISTFGQLVDYVESGGKTLPGI